MTLRVHCDGSWVVLSDDAGEGLVVVEMQGFIFLRSSLGACVSCVCGVGLARLSVVTISVIKL